MQEKMTTGNNVNKVITVCGYDEIYNFMADHFIDIGDDRFRYNNISMSVLKDYLGIGIYTDSINHICAATIVLNYDDFAIRYRPRDNDIKLLSRGGEKISDKVYIHLM